MTAYRVAVQGAGGVFAVGDTFDGVDEAREAAAGAGQEFPGQVVDVQELVQDRGRLVWRSVDAPPARRGWLARLFQRG